jgi:hypothetical protein
MDVVLTQEGRRQLAAGKFVPMFASFTDRHTFYEQDVASGSADPSRRIYFEAGNRHQDQIVVETDDSGLLVPYDGGTTKISSDGRIYSASYKEIGLPSGSYNAVRYDAPAATFGTVFSNVANSIIDSYNQQTMIKTSYPYEKYSDFSLSNDAITFNYNNFVPFKGTKPEITVDAADPLFVDKRLSHLPNFKFLPPVYRDSSGKIQNLGEYESLKTTDELTYPDLMSQLKGTDPNTVNKEKIEITFSETSLQSNVFMQLFEGKNNTPDGIPSLRKLEYIDFGEFKDENDKDRPFKRVFFVGKVYLDEYESPTYINLFTIVAE